MLHDDPPVDEALEIDEAGLHILGKTIDPADADDPEVGSLGEDRNGALLEIGRSHDLQVVPGD